MRRRPAAAAKTFGAAATSKAAWEVFDHVYLHEHESIFV